MNGFIFYDLSAHLKDLNHQEGNTFWIKAIFSQKYEDVK